MAPRVWETGTYGQEAAGRVEIFIHILLIHESKAYGYFTRFQKMFYLGTVDAIGNKTDEASNLMELRFSWKESETKR